MSLFTITTYLLYASLFFSPLGQDSDGDGIPDKKDHCPDVPGLKNNKGCPEGIVPPSYEFRMDRDMDGVENDIDECPDTFGSFEQNGCPIPISLAGLVPTASHGEVAEARSIPIFAKIETFEPPVEKDARSPYKDADHDGIYNVLDKCPKSKGAKELYGCPAFTNEETQMLKDITEKVKFEPYKANMYSNAEPVLLELAKWLNEVKPQVRIRMGIYTDDGWGTEESANLATERGKIITQFLLKQGVARERMQMMNFGRMRPLVNDYTEVGKTQNRRVEVEVIFP